MFCDEILIFMMYFVSRLDDLFFVTASKFEFSIFDIFDKIFKIIKFEFLIFNNDFNNKINHFKNIFIQIMIILHKTFTFFNF